MSDEIRINGNQFSWGSIILKIDGERFYGLTSLSYGDKRVRKKTYGMGKAQAPRGRTRGKYEPDPGKIGGAKSTVQALIDLLASKSSDGKSFGNVSFEALAQYIDEGENPITVRLEDCVVTGHASSESEGQDELNDELEIDYMRVYRNGKTLFDSTPG